MLNSSKVALLILDGWGLGRVPEADAIAQANTPFFDSLMAQYPHAQLTTHGEAVGLPDGQMGNSEVGHLNIGAGRVVYQELARINKAARTSELADNPQLQNAIHQAQANHRPVHLFGLVSDGGVHSHLQHLIALCRILQDKVSQVYIHAFTDGRDTDPKSGAHFLAQVMDAIRDFPNVHLASIVGRYYAMDRDKRWERVKIAYDLLTKGIGQPFSDPVAALHNAYSHNLTDEFMPALCGADFHPITDGDVVLSFNFRTDRCREITQVLTQQAFPEFEMQPLDLHYYTMTRYDDSFQNVSVLFEKDNLSMTLGEVIEAHQLTQLRIAETEKYPHVTFFFSGGREQPFSGENRVIIPSPKVATYDLQPQMSALEITNTVLNLPQIPNFICLNYANADMVGHTGDFQAAMTAAETVDNCLSQLVPHLLAQNCAIIIIADHGNSDYMRNPDGSPNTAHTTNPVPCIIAAPNLSPNSLRLRDGILADVAPTILQILSLPIPPVMDGRPLF